MRARSGSNSGTVNLANEETIDRLGNFHRVSFDPNSDPSGITRSQLNECSEGGDSVSSPSTRQGSGTREGSKAQQTKTKITTTTTSGRMVRDVGTNSTPPLGSPIKGAALRDSLECARNNEGEMWQHCGGKKSAGKSRRRQDGAGADCGCECTRATSSEKLHSDGSAKENARRSKRATRREHPLDAANLISKLFFGWMFPFIWRGWRSGLRRADMPSQVSKAESCHRIGERLVAHWDKELAAYGSLAAPPNDLYAEQLEPDGKEERKEEAKRPSLARAMIRTHGSWILLNSLLTFFSEVVCKSLSAYSVGQMLLHMSQRELVDFPRLSSLDLLDPLVFWTLMLILAVCSWVMSAHFYGFQMMRVGLHVRLGCSYLIYRKSLKLGQHESIETTMGRMTNLLSNDLDKFNYVCIMVPFLWVGPIHTVVSIYLLWPILGPSCLGAILVLAILTPIQFYLSRKFASFRRRIAAHTDERVRLLTETITALKLIKLYGWEYSFQATMAESRRKETNLINRVSIIKGISVAFMYVSSKMVLFVTLIFHTLVFGKSLDAQTLFMSLAMLDNVQFTMTQLLPRVVSLGVESLVSLGRIRDFLLIKEFGPSKKLAIEPVHQKALRLDSNYKKSDIPGGINSLTPSQTDSSKRRAFVELEMVRARWSAAETIAIDGFTFKCEAPNLIIICGQVASGKSSLFMSLLNELPISEGKAKLCGTLGYSSQTPWIFNGTVRENIIFGQSYNEQRYNQILDCCALKRDMELLEYGDFTYIQEDSLSGGQKARVNLARCLYRDCDIYLLDDPFSAIDRRVARHIFEEALTKFLSGKLILLATHQVHLLERADKILLLDRGKQLAFCGYQELRAKLSCASREHFSREQLERLSFLSQGLDKEANEETDAPRAGGVRGLISLDDDKVKSVDLKCVSSIIGEGNEGERRRESNINKENNTRAANDFGAHSDNEAKTKNSFAVNALKSEKMANTQQSALAGKELSKQSSSRSVVLDEEQIDCDIRQAKLRQQIEQPRQRQEELQEQQWRQQQQRDDKCDKILKLEPTPCRPIHAPYGLSDASTQIEVGNLITVQEASRSVAHATVSQLEVGSGGASSSSNRISSISKGNDHSFTVPLAEQGGAKESERQPANKVRQDINLPTTQAVNIEKVLYRTKINHQPAQVEHHQQATRSKEGKISTSTSKYERQQEEGRGVGGGNFGNSRNQPLSNEEEETPSGRLPGLRVWYKYYTQTSVIRLVLIVLTFLITQALFSTVDIYLTVWSLIEQNKALVSEITGSNQQHLATFKQQANHHAINNGTNIINYDLMPNSNSPTLLMLWSLPEYNGTSSAAIEMAQEIQQVGISPLSSRSSQLTLVGPPSKFSFVSRLDLLYATTTTTNTDQAKATLAEPKTYPLNVERKQQQQLQQSSALRNDQIVGSTGNALEYSSVFVDRDILEESEAALNVKSIYRPLYLFVNNFTSGQHALTYTLLLMALFSCSIITNVLSLTSSNKSAISLYKKLTDNALFAKIAFFDQNPVGRFLNRATRDIGVIDEAIPYTANQAYDALLRTAATFIVLAIVDINLALPSLIVLFIFLIYHSIHVNPTRDIQRLEGVLRSPIISHVSTTLTGLQTIRATKSEHRFEQLFMRHQDAHTSVFLLYLGCNRTMAIVLDSLNATFIGVIAFWSVVSGLSGPSAGLIITSAMLLGGLTQHGVMKLTETESLMTSVERVIEYCSLPQEENYGRHSGGQARHIVRGNNGLLKRGSVEYKNVDLYYKKLDKPVLKNISFKINSGEKIGIIGRTGAGKSSIITTLFRLYEFEGTILIDGVDIKQVDLLNLRTSIGIIPQTPILFSTSIRQNLDPLNVYDDFSIWTALDKAHLRETVSALPGKLNYRIGNSGCCFSLGQKQLVCLARVLLRQCSLIVMDEATANVDPATDAIIQTTIRREFKHCTVITIAHRLETIVDCDRIMVLEAGRIVDFDTPEQLVARGNSCFAVMLGKSSTTGVTRQ